MAIKTSKTAEMRFANYKTNKTQAVNRLRKLQALQKKQPNNTQVFEAAKSVGYRRNTPKVPVWSHSMIATAKLMKEFTGKFNKLMFNPDPMIRHGACMSRDPNKFLPQISKRELYVRSKVKVPPMFSIAARLAAKESALWS